jgi:uncharacterized protein (DUF433 family)
VSLSVLDREMFSEPEAARLLRGAPSTLHYWLEGGQRRGKTYQPVIRLEPEDRRSVTWAEFIEAGLLREYRREHNVPFVGDRQLVREAQDDAGLDADYCLVVEVRGQLVLTATSELFVRRITWKDDLAARWRPHDDRRSPVAVDPRVRFGKPAIRGISTEALWEHTEAGEGFEETAESFGLSPDDVRWAFAYETSNRAA